jgi:hypothetical protein
MRPKIIRLTVLIIALRYLPFKGIFRTPNFKRAVARVSRVQNGVLFAAKLRTALGDEGGDAFPCVIGTAGGDD